MTTDEIIAREIANGNDAAADAAYELYQGERKVTVEENPDQDKMTHPVILNIDGVKVKLHGTDAEALVAGINQVLFDAIEGWREAEYRSRLIDREEQDKQLGLED